MKVTLRDKHQGRSEKEYRFWKQMRRYHLKDFWLEHPPTWLVALYIMVGAAVVVGAAVLAVILIAYGPAWVGVAVILAAMYGVLCGIVWMVRGL